MSNPPIDFESAEFALRHSWEVHRQAFGPILEPAFVENPQVRILVINALNHISRREIQRGMELLKELHPHCIYDEDKAAWAFFVGLCFEMGGAQKQMLEWYEKAGQIGHMAFCTVHPINLCVGHKMHCMYLVIIHRTTRIPPV